MQTSSTRKKKDKLAAGSKLEGKMQSRVLFGCFRGVTLAALLMVGGALSGCPEETENDATAAEID
jgi:hypothetical protein